MSQDAIDKEVDEYFKRNFRALAAPEAPGPAASGPARQEEAQTAPSSFAAILEAMERAQQPPPVPQGRQPVQSVAKLTPGQEQAIAGAAGAYVGTKIAPGIHQMFLPKAQREAEGLQRLQQELQARRILEEAARVNMGQLGNLPETPSLMSDVEYMAQSGRGEARPQLTGRQMESAHNWETQRQSLATRQNLQRPGAASTLVEAGPGVPTRAGIWVPKSSAATISAEEAAAAARQVEESQRLAQTLAARQLAENTPGALSRLGSAMVGPKVTGALGGLGAGMSAYEAYQANKQGDPTGTALASLSGLSSLASMYPPFLPVALPVGIGAGGMQYIRSRLEPDRPVSAEEERAASRAAFGVYPSSGKRKPRSSP